MSIRRVIACIGAVAIASALVGCSSSGNSDKNTTGTNSGSPASGVSGTVTAGVLTIAFPDFPYPGMAEGSNPSDPTGGYFVDVAKSLAKSMNLDLKFEGIDFNAMIGGQAKNYDIAMDSFSITPDRQQKFDMTIPIYSDHVGIVTNKSANASTVDDIRNMTLGSCGGCDTFQYITTVIKPHKTPRGFDQDLAKYMAVQNGQIDGALGNVPTILAKLTLPQFNKLKLACKLPQPSEYAFILKKGSPFFDKVQQLLKAMDSDGTLADLLKKDLNPTLGGVDPDAVPDCPSFS